MPSKSVRRARYLQEFQGDALGVNLLCWFAIEMLVPDEAQTAVDYIFLWKGIVASRNMYLNTYYKELLKASDLTI